MVAAEAEAEAAVVRYSVLVYRFKSTRIVSVKLHAHEIGNTCILTAC